MIYLVDEFSHDLYCLLTVDSHSAVMDKSAVSLTSGSSDVNHPSNRPARSGQGKATGSSVPSNSIDVVALGVNDVHTEQKSAGSLPLPRPSSSEVRFTSSNPKSMSDQTSHEQHIGEGKFHNRARGVVKNAVNDAYVPRPASSHSNSTGSRPSSNYSNRSHQTAGPQRGNYDSFLSAVNKKFQHFFLSSLVLRNLFLKTYDIIIDVCF